jgi:hypothetical protein
MMMMRAVYVGNITVRAKIASSHGGEFQVGLSLVEKFPFSVLASEARIIISLLSLSCARTPLFSISQ